MGFILFLVSLVLFAIFAGASLIFTPIYYIVTLKWRSGVKALNNYFYQLAIGIDQLGNRLASQVLNVTLLKYRAKYYDRPDWPGMEFGEIDDTISYVLGVNYYSDNLTGIGIGIVKILAFLESYHVERALCFKYLADVDAGVRLQSDFFYKLDKMKAKGDPKLNALIDQLLGNDADYTVLFDKESIEKASEVFNKAEEQSLKDLDNMVPRGTPRPPRKRSND